MNLEIYIPNEDTLLTLYQEGSYITQDAKYIKSDNYLTASHWEGTLKFTPDNQPVWSVKFHINKYFPILSFLNNSKYTLELPDSAGFIWIYHWKK